MKNRLDGITFSKMALCGYRNLVSVESEINAMNVFPVADGDTGTNMRLTLELGLKNAKSSENLGEYLKGLSSNMLLGARGNSGVILSQLFKGMYLSLAEKDFADPNDLKEALISSYQCAYKAVVHPVEGTILTVAREGIENIKNQITGDTPILDLFSAYLAEMRKILVFTPDILPVLKSAGVVDSGAFGYITILDGMTKFLRGEDNADDASDLLALAKANPSHATAPANSALFNENSDFVDGYCMEFLLQLMNSKHYQDTFSVEAYTAALNPLGESTVVIKEGTLVKVHIHTFSPSPIITLSQQYGEFVAFKLENMTLQHMETYHKEGESAPAKDFGIIAVVDGDGLQRIYKDLGCDIVISGGKTLNVSSGEIKEAIEALNAETTVILPNNENSFEAVHQAIGLLPDKKVVVVPSTNPVEGYFALSMDVGDSDDVDYRIESIKSGTEGADVLTIFTAVKDYRSGDFSCVRGDEIAILNGKSVYAGKELIETFSASLKFFKDMEDKASFVVFLGKDVEDLGDTIYDILTEEFPDMEVYIQNGGQHTFEIMLGAL